MFKRSKPEFGKVSADDASQIDAAVYKLVLCCDSGRIRHYTGFTAPFVHQDWANRFLRVFYSQLGRRYVGLFCQDMWVIVMHLRAKLPHLRNHTNNRLEVFSESLRT
ncbi:hypothetical protein GQ600_17347 [Phytophthora cactorum]|nr:hypothetical protein GQ600_17347 [Phytophthora cactorum]